MSKKTVENARKFLWDDDGDASAKTRGSTTNLSNRTFSTRDYAVDQSVNLMAMGDQPSPQASEQGNNGVFGLFRAGGGPPPRFDEYGDAAASNEAEEYISDKGRRVSPIWAACQGAVSGCSDCLVSCITRLGTTGVTILCCLFIGIVILVSAVTLAEEAKPLREHEIESRIVDSGMTDRTIFAIPALSSPQKQALKWIVYDDPANLKSDAPGLLERYALAVFYFGTNAERTGWKSGENWLSAKGYCLWEGIECIPRDDDNGNLINRYDENAPIYGIALPDNEMEGIIPSEFGQFINVLTLDFQNNELSGDIPSTLTKMTSLRSLLLRKNKFVGTISEDLMKTGLHELHLGENSFDGTIPESISNMKELRNLALNDNLFTGTLPDMSKLTRLMRLWIDNNDMEGTIPTWISSLKDLIELHMGNNRFSGSIETSIQSLKNLEVLRLNDNNFNGEVPNFFDHLKRITDLQLQGNEFKGKLPPSIEHLNDLEVLRLDDNQFTGGIPDFFYLLPDVEVMILDKNQLTGSIPTLIGKLDDIKHLSFSFNELDGSIPSEFGGCFRLTTLHLQGNSFTGIIPSELGRLDQLTSLKLEANSFSGVAMPSQICSLVITDDLTQLTADCGEKITCDCCSDCV